MVKGLDIFRKYFADYKDQYVLIGGAACDVVFEGNDANFRAKAYLDLKERKEAGGTVDSNDIKKHKKDILRIAAELMLEKVINLPESVNKDIHMFIAALEQVPFDQNSLKMYGVKNDDVIALLKQVFG